MFFCSNNPLQEAAYIGMKRRGDYRLEERLFLH